MSINAYSSQKLENLELDHKAIAKLGLKPRLLRMDLYDNISGH
jgi:hypothetical protein